MTNTMRFKTAGTAVLAVLALGACGAGGHETSLSTSPSTTIDDVVGDCPTEDSCQLDYVGGDGWYVDGERVEGVSCPTEDSCTPMYHPDEDGWMIHEVTP